ncbi:MAG: outer membrane protein transport protein [Gemmatimonadota bacterium]
MRARTLTGALVCGLLTLQSADAARAQTNGFVLQCLSAQASGLGCVTRAQPEMPTSLFRDPAALVAFDRPTLEVNLTSFSPTVTFSNAANPEEVTGARHVYPLFSAAFTGARLGDDVAWAVGVEPIGGFGSDFMLQHPLLSGAEGTPVGYETFFAALKAGPAVAWRFAQGWSVGASVSLTYAQIRDFRMPFTLPPSAPLGMGGIAQLDPAVYGPLFQQFTELTAYGDSQDYDGFGWTADVGLRYQHENGLTVAASWTPERPIELKGGTAEIDMTAQFEQMLGAMVMARAQAYGETAEEAQAAVMAQLGQAGLDLGAGVASTYSAATRITLPMTLGAGLSAPLSSSLRLAGEVEWRRWSEAQGTMPFLLSNGTNPNLNLMMNGDATDATFEYPFPLEWRDTWTAKVGLEYLRESGWGFRGGFLYGENPVPDNTVFIAFPAIATNALTLGTTVPLGSVGLDLSLVQALNTQLDGCGEAHLNGAEYLNSTSGLQQTVITAGVRWMF